MSADRILIDGRSGAGKSQLALDIVAELTGAQLVRLDDIYPGWDGLEEGSAHVYEHVLSADAPRWQRWDWVRGERAQWHELDPERPIVIEGCGALSSRNRALASLGIWIDLDEASRRARVVARDGERVLEFWDRWAAQEDAFIARENPRDLADLVVDGREGSGLPGLG